MRSLTAGLAAGLFLAAAARAEVLHVPKDFATIQAAVDASVAGDTILIAAGTYPEQVVVDGVSDLQLRGQGQVELTGTELQVGLTINGSFGVLAQKLRFRGFAAGVVVTGSTDIVLRQCRVEENVESALIVEDSADVLLDHCVVDGAGNQGVDFDNVLGGIVRRCTLLDANNGLNLQDCKGVEVDRLRLEHIAVDGILVGDGSVGVWVRDARITDVQADGILVSGDFNRFEHDLIVGAGGSGVLFGPAAQGNVLNHERVVGSGDVAFFLGGVSQEARGCRAVHAGGTGILCFGSGPQLVLDNRVLKPQSSGIFVDLGCTHCSLLDNRVVHAVENGLDTSGDQTTVSGNVSTGAGADGFRIESSLNMVTDNKAHGSGDLDLLETVSGDSVYLDNHFGTEQHP